MSTGTGAGTPLQFHPQTDEEDRARAGYYGLLARLYYAEPDAKLLSVIADSEPAETPETAFARAWRSLALAARAMDAEAAGLEYDEIFIGTGKSEVTPYATYYLAEVGRERLLLRLKEELASAGLARAEQVREPEDHLAALFDVMRHLISAGSSDAALQNQRRFFERYIEPAYRAFCDALSASHRANFYKHVGALTRAFLDVESEALKVY